MSRYNVSNDDIFTKFVGWDNPLQSFFIQSFTNYDQEDEALVLALGTKFKEIPDLRILEKTLQRWGIVVSEYVWSRLVLDFENRTDPTPLQKMLNDFFGKFED